MKNKIPIAHTKYRVIKTIGKGGFGQTKLVEDKKTGNKYIRKQTAFDKSDPNYDPSQAKFYLDYQTSILKQLKKKKICSNFICPIESYTKDGETFIIMDFLEGFKDLTDVEIKGKKDKLKICKSLIDSVLELHANSIVHVDIKPPNIMINPKTLELRIIDFGTGIINDKKKKKFDVIGYSADFSFLDLDKKGYSFETLKLNDMLALGMTLVDFLARIDDSCKNVDCYVDKDFYESIESVKAKKRKEVFKRMNFLEMYQEILSDYLSDKSIRFFSRRVYNPNKENFKKVNKEEKTFIMTAISR